MAALEDLSTSRDIVCVYLRFEEIDLYFYIYKFFRERLWVISAVSPYFLLNHAKLLLVKRCIR